MTYRRTEHSTTDKIFGVSMMIVGVFMLLLFIQAHVIMVVGMFTNSNTFREPGVAMLTTKYWLPMPNHRSPVKMNYAQRGPGYNPKYDSPEDDWEAPRDRTKEGCAQFDGVYYLRCKLLEIE